MKKGLFQLQYELDAAQPYTESGSAKGAKLYADMLDEPNVKEPCGGSTPTTA